MAEWSNTYYYVSNGTSNTTSAVGYPSFPDYDFPRDRRTTDMEWLKRSVEEIVELGRLA